MAYLAANRNLKTTCQTTVKAVTAAELVSLIKGIFSYKHSVFYYGSRTIKDAQSTLAKYHKPPKTLRDYPAATVFTEQKTDKSRVLLVPYDGMVQAQVVMLAKDQLFDKNLMPAASLFGEYFGGGMSCGCVPMREARALAYSAWAGYTSPQRTEPPLALYQAFMAIQADKLKDAIGALSAAC